MDRLAKAFLVIAAIGIPDAAYHAYDEITNYSAPGSNVCNINHFFSCGSVFTSGYTTFLGVSMYVYGLVWFPLMLVLGYLFLSGAMGRNARADVLLLFLMVGNFFTLYLWYLELGVIHAICPVCVSLYCLNYVLTGLSAYSLYRQA